MQKDVYSREETKYIKTGIYVVLVILAMVLYLATNKEKMAHKDGGTYYNVDARFNRTDGLLVGDKVRLAGMDVGRVISSRLDDHFKAILTLDIKDGIHVPDDSSASIVSSGLIGSKYIEIEPGGSEDYIPQGGEFSYTQDAMVLEELLDRIVSMGKANRNKNAVCPSCADQNKK